MNQAGLPPGFWAIFIVALVVGLAIGLTIQVFFLLTLYRTQSAVAERNREIAPGSIWWTLFLNFIPIVGNIWVITLVSRLSNSLRREFEDRGWRTNQEGFGRQAGMLWAWGGLGYMFISLIQNVLQFSGEMAAATTLSLLVLPIAIGLLVCFIMFWVQMAQYGKRLREGERGYRAGSLEDDYDDERRPRRDAGDRFDDSGRRDRDKQ